MKKKTQMWESLVKASSDYLAKEQVRKEIQDLIENRIKNGQISSQEELTAFFAVVKMSMLALEHVPYDAFVANVSKVKKPKRKV